MNSPFSIFVLVNHKLSKSFDQSDRIYLTHWENVKIYSYKLFYSVIKNTSVELLYGFQR